MARVIYSPLITSMSGKIGDAVMSRWKGIDYVRSRVIPANPQSAAQTIQREALADTLTMWQSIKTWARAVWNEYATGYAKSGYNRYMEDNILKVRDSEAGKITPFNADYIKVSGANAAAGGAGEITFTWTNDTGVPPEVLALYYRKTESGAEAYAWTLHDNHSIGSETATITGLDTGEDYEVAGFARTWPALTAAQESYNEVLAAG